MLGSAVFEDEPTGKQTAEFLDSVVAKVGRAPKYTITDKGSQFHRCGEYQGWCDQHGVKPRFGKVGKHGSIAVVERFILSLKDECTRRVKVSFNVAQFEDELSAYIAWFNLYRPHMTLDGATPEEKYSGRTPVHQLFRYETRPDVTAASSAQPQAPPIGPKGVKLELDISYFRGRKHLPIFELKRIAC